MEKTDDKLRGLAPFYGGERVYIPKRPLIDPDDVRRAREAGFSAAEIARQMGVSERTIYRKLAED